jgi:3',5'-cyclic AMP phosphodiesterase CpdA
MRSTAKLLIHIVLLLLTWSPPLQAGESLDLFIPAILACSHHQQHQNGDTDPPPPQDPPAGWRFVVTGDSRGDQDGINRDVLDTIRDAILDLNPRPALVIFTGDLVSRGSEKNLTHWKNAFKQPLEQHNIKVYPLRGNHDGSKERFRAVFADLPKNGPDGQKGLTYMVRYRNAEFYILDNTWDGGGINAVTRTWLYARLAASQARHGFIAGHSPLWGAGHHSPLYDDSNDPEVVELYSHSLAAHTSTYLCGHDHFFDLSIKESKDGIFRQFLLGTAGAPLRDQDDPDDLDPHASQVLHLKEYGFSIFDISGDRVKTRFVSTGNSSGGNHTYEYVD